MDMNWDISQFLSGLGCGICIGVSILAFRNISNLKTTAKVIKKVGFYRWVIFINYKRRFKQMFLFIPTIFIVLITSRICTVGTKVLVQLVNQN